MRRSSAVFSFIAVVAIAVAGCGGSASTNAPGAASAAPASDGAPAAATSSAATPAAAGTPVTPAALPDPCKLLTADEIKGVVGHTVAAGRANGTGECVWDRSGVSEISVYVKVMILPGTLGCQIGGSKPVDGLGPQAGWSYLAAGNTGSVTVCPSRLQVKVTLVGDNVTHTTPEDLLRTDAVALMKLALPRT
jgi:hypothetical protein